MNPLVVEDKILIQIYIEYVMNISTHASKFFSLNKADTSLKFQKLTCISDYNVSTNLEENYKQVDILFRQFQYFTELLAHHDLSLKYDSSNIHVYLPKNKKNILEDPLLIIGPSLIHKDNEGESQTDKNLHSIGQYGNLFLSLLTDKYSLPLNKLKQRQIMEEIKYTPLYFALQRCIHPVKKERKVLMI